MKLYGANLLITLLGLATLTSCGARGNVPVIAGTVSVNGAPVEIGTIHFQSAISPGSNGGAAVSDGNFRAESEEGFAPGEYTVTLTAFRKTGRIINDPQKGKVEQTTTVSLAEPSQKVAVDAASAERLALDFAAAK